MAENSSFPTSSPLPHKQPYHEPLVSASRDPAIRTMKSDVERLFKTAPPSVAQMVGTPHPQSASLKRHARIASAYLVLGVVVIAVILLGAGAYYFHDTFFPRSVTTEAIKATPPSPLFATENSRTLEINHADRQKFMDLMNDAMKEFERNGTITRILIRFPDTPDQHYISFSDFLDFYHITPPQNLTKRLGADLMLFVYNTSSGATRLGLGVRTNDPNRTLRDFLDWEPQMLTDLKPLFFGQQLSPVSGVFEDRSYRNIDWRFLKLSSDTDIGIGYTIFPAGNTVIITTSREEMETVINRLFEQK